MNKSKENKEKLMKVMKALLQKTKPNTTNENLVSEIIWYLENGMPLGTICILEKLGATKEEIKKAEKAYDEL